MHSSALAKRMLSWLIACGVLLASLAPSLSFAISASQGAGTVEICTAQGMVLVSVDEKGQGLPPVWSAHHCKLCCIHGQDLAPPANAQAATPLVQAHHVLAGRPLGLPPAAQTWWAPLARAPPLPGS